MDDNDIKLPERPEPDGFITDGPFDKPVVINVYRDSTLEAYAREAVRLNAWEPRAITHAADCWSWGAAHYECAMREIERLRKMHQGAYQRGLQAGSRGLLEIYDAIQAAKRQDAWGNTQLTEALMEAEERAERAEAENERLREELSKMQAEPSDETLRLAGIIADKIEDGTLFQAGIFSRRDLADRVRAVVRAARYGAQPAASAQPVAWVAADTLKSPHPGCVSSLAYVSQIDKDRGREYVPLYAAPVAAQTADAGLDVEAVLRLFLTGDGFIAACDIPHIVAALTAQPAASAETKKAVTVSQLEMLFESEDVDRQQPGYHWRKGWNAAIRRCMDIAYPMYAAPVAALTAQPAVGEEIMVNAAHDVYTLPLQPSGLDGQGPRFVVHVPPPEPQAAEIEELLAALRQIAEWPDGGNRYGQENIKRFAQAAIDAAMQRTSGGEE